MARRPSVRVGRVYEPRTRQDGFRVLVDRIWPRGLTKEKADLDEWCKSISPSTDLRRWYNHDPDRFDEFKHRYKGELKETERTEALRHLRELVKKETLTLLTATRDVDISEAVVIAGILRGTTKS